MILWLLDKGAAHGLKGSKGSVSRFSDLAPLVSEAGVILSGAIVSCMC